MTEELPTWLPSFEEPQFLGMAGWQGRLFAVVEHAGGASLCFHDGEVRTASSVLELARSCTADERALLGMKLGELEVAEQLVEIERLAASGATVELSALVERLGGAEAPGLIARPLDAGPFIASGLRNARRLLRDGDGAAAAAQLRLLDDVEAADPPDWAGFFWWTEPADVLRACAADLPPADPKAVPGTAEGWTALALAFPVLHPAGVEVEVLPVPPGSSLGEDSPLRRAYRRCVNSMNRLARLKELDAPESMQASIRETVTDCVGDLVALAQGPAQSAPADIRHANARVTPLATPPPVGPSTGLFRVPYHYPGTYVVQGPDALRVVSTEGVLHELPACPWRPLFGSGRFVVYAGEVVSGQAPSGVAVLDTEEGRWMERWPDDRGLRFLHSAWLPETDGHGAHWLVDPRVPDCRVLAGRVAAFEAELGRGQMVVDADGKHFYTAPAPDGLAVAPMQLPETPPSWRIDATTGEIGSEPWNNWDDDAVRSPQMDAPWSPSDLELAALSRAAHGGILVCWRGALYVNDERIALFDGPVQAVALEGGNGTRNGYLGLLTPTGILGIRFEAHGEDDPGSLSLDHRVPLPS